MAAASGEHLVVLDVNRHYSPDSLIRVLDPIRGDQCDLAVAVPARALSIGEPDAIVARVGLDQPDVAGHVRRFLGLVRTPSRGVGFRDVSIGPRADRAWFSTHCCDDRRGASTCRWRWTIAFGPSRIGLRDLRPLKRILDGRFGNYSRLVQFCMVGASGMVVDLSFYALLQFLLSFTWLADRKSALFGCTWHLAIAAGHVDRDRLVWNFTLNRRLTFNDAHKGALLRQFFTYVLSNALAIVLSFSVQALSSCPCRFLCAAPAGGGGRGDRGGDGHQLLDGALAGLRAAARARSSPPISRSSSRPSVSRPSVA